MTDTERLAAFLLARIDEDEEIAQAAAPGPWFATENELWASPIVCEAHWPGLSEGEAAEAGGRAGPPHYVIAQTMQGGQRMIDAQHIARHDPARVLADCAARRRLVAEIAPTVGGYDSQITSEWGGEDAGTEVLMLQILGQPHADHPEFDPAWRLAGT